jgi:UDP-N-acetyl-D-mannosaminuronic acid dehydrogenase
VTTGDLRVEVSIVGGGYVGYPLAVLAASSGLAVTVVDVDETVVADINAGRPRIEDEPGLVRAAALAHDAGLLRASTASVPSRIYVIAVPTPVSADGRSPDLTLAVKATESIVPTLRRGALVIVESTVPPGTCERIVRPILESGGLQLGTDLSLAHCPERVLPGQTVDELRFGERIIGGYDDASVGGGA